MRAVCTPADRSFAEYLPLVNPEEWVRARHVVECVNGRISKQITHSFGARYFVVSERPCLVGNKPASEEELARMRPVALLGQARVFVKGDVADNAFLVPAGDGYARALSAEESKDPKLQSRCLGIVWKQSEAPCLGEDTPTEVPSVIAYVASGVGLCALSMADLLSRVCQLETMLASVTSIVQCSDHATAQKPLVESMVRGTCARMSSTAVRPMGVAEHAAWPPLAKMAL